MSSFVICFLVVVVFLFVPSLVMAGKDDPPSYADSKQSPESTMTESQKAMQQYLTNLGKLGYEQGMQAFDPERIKRGNAFYNAALNAIQNGTGRDPQSINAAVNQTMAQQPANEVPAEQSTQNKLPSNLDEVVRYYDYLQNQQKNRNTPFATGAQAGQRFNESDEGFKLYLKGGIDDKTIEAYRRQKQAADDAALLAKMGGK